jgi:hypothetical protein
MIFYEKPGLTKVKKPVPRTANLFEQKYKVFLGSGVSLLRTLPCQVAGGE